MEALKDLSIGKDVIFFDGVCNLCNGFIQFLIEFDRKKKFHFAPLQSELGQKLMQEMTAQKKGLDSIILVTRDSRVYTESTAVLRIMTGLPGLWRLLYVFIVVPKGIRDAVYRKVARNRYLWFGQQDHCMIPTPEIMGRFIS